MSMLANESAIDRFGHLVDGHVTPGLVQAPDQLPFLGLTGR